MCFYFILQMSNMCNIKVGVVTLILSVRKLRTNWAFAMVSLVGRGFCRGDKK